MLSSSPSLLLSLSAASGCSISTSAAVSQLCTQMGGAEVTHSHEETRQDREMQAEEEVMRGLGVISNPEERKRLGFASWWRMQRKDRPVHVVRRLEDWERMHEEGSCVLHQTTETSRRVSTCRQSSRQHQCLDSVERLLQQLCVRCQWQDKEVSVAHICLGDLHQRMWWASKVIRTSRTVSVPLHSVFSLSVKQPFIIPSKKSQLWTGSSFKPKHLHVMHAQPCHYEQGHGLLRSAYQVFDCR